MCILFSLVFIFLDIRVASFREVHSNLSLIMLPIHYLVDLPIQSSHWAVNSIISQHKLLADNARFREHELLLESKLQKLLELERENRQLRELLKSTSNVSGHVVVAQLLAVGLNPSLQQMIVDKGKSHDIYVGQPVLDAYGILGQVVRVEPLTSRVLLITDPKNAIPVRDSRNGVRAIAVGTGNDEKLKLINVPNTTDIKIGDLFTSSGLGLRYPVGYPVGKVINVGHSTEHRFAHVTLVPAAHLNRSQQVLMAWPVKAALSKSVQQELNAKLP